MPNLLMPLYITINTTGKRRNFITSNTQDIYWLLLNKIIQNKEPTCIKRWEETYKINSNIWPDIFEIPFKVCRETYLQSFQYRIIHRILPCKYWLNKLKIVENNICTYKYCTNKEPDTIQHFLINCPPVIDFWESFVTWWNQLDYFKLRPLIEVNIILGFPNVTNEDTVLNYCLILAKQYIYSCKAHEQQLFLLSFLQILKNKLNIEKEIHIQRSTLTKFYSSWGYLQESL